MIRNERGDLLHSQTVALVNAVNCHGVMGKGIALQFKKAFLKPIRSTARPAKMARSKLDPFSP
ncbi:macro domain-containing protein [Kosakonia cowanii]